MSIRKILLFCFALSIAGVAAQADVLHMTPNELVERADLVALAEVISVNQGIDSTHSQLQLLQVLKGAETAGAIVQVESHGGKVLIDENEPTFNTMESNLVFLQKTDQGYRCLNQADGQKIIRGKNLYPYHDNIAYGVPFQDYLKSLDTILKAKGPKRA